LEKSLSQSAKLQWTEEKSTPHVAAMIKGEVEQAGA
jgi:hypothetical protein